MSRYVLYILTGLALVTLFGCSGGGLPTDPSGMDGTLSDIRYPEGESKHVLLGLYDIWIDPVSMTAEAFPSRIANPHYNVTQYVTAPMCADCITAVVTHMDDENHIATVDITIKNPTPYDGFDVRGILLLGDLGHDLLSPDGWVSIFDDGQEPYYNPFMRYGKQHPDGLFPGMSSRTATYKIQLPTPPKYHKIKFAIDAFRPKNGKREPYAIDDGYVDGYLFSDGSNQVTLSVRVLDRHDDVVNVTVECPDLFLDTIDMTEDGENWTVKISNDYLAPASAEPYILTVEAFDAVSSYTLRDVQPVFVIEQTLGWKPFFGMQEMSTCSVEIAGASLGLSNAGAYMVDPMSGCSSINGLDMTFTIPLTTVSLPNINPGNPSLQPYPPVRFDSAGSGALCFSNEGSGTFVNGTYLPSQDQVVVTLDDSLSFKDDDFGDHQAHHPFFADSLKVADVCNGFINRFYMLWVSDTGDDPPLFRSYAANYTTKEQVIGVYFPPEFIGDGPGLIANDITKILAIDVREVEDAPPVENVELYILESTGLAAEVEIFNIYTDKNTGASVITHVHTILLGEAMGEALDLELLPLNTDYEANPTAASIVLLFRDDYDGLFGGYIEIFDTVTWVSVDNIGSVDEAAIFDMAMYMDVLDDSFGILATSVSELSMGSTMIFSFSYG